jgi:hypothetical protein
MALVTVRMAKTCPLTRDDGSKIIIPVGVQAIDERDANHWYVKAHMEKEAPPALGDYAYALALRQAADALLAQWSAAEAQAVTSEAAFQAKHAPPEVTPAEPALPAPEVKTLEPESGQVGRTEAAAVAAGSAAELPAADPPSAAPRRRTLPRA